MWQSFKRGLWVAVGVLGAATCAQAAYNVTIAASGSSSGGSWVGNTWTPSANGSTVLASEVATHLSAGATVIGTAGAGADNGDISVNSAVSWLANSLTLSAQRNIAINANLNASGTASLILEYGQGAVAAGNTASYNLHVPVNLAATGSFSTKLGSNGGSVGYTIVTGLGTSASSGDGTLQGMVGNLAGKYVLGADIDATPTGQGAWYAAGGFAPVGSQASAFTGVFDGLGHAIANLTINRPATDDIGLFGYTQGSTLRNIGLTNAAITGRNDVGGLAGFNDGIIGNAYSTGSVSGTTNVGGLVGYANSSTIAKSYSTASVGSTSSSGGGTVAGGLAGVMNGGTITNSYAIGAVTATDWQHNSAIGGGLVGWVFGGGTVANSYATGLISCSSSGMILCGGLVGNSAGTVNTSFWDTQTSGQATGFGDNAGTFTAVGKTTAEMKSLATFAGWGIDAAGGTATVWRIYDGYTYPLLRDFLTPLTLVPAYDGSGAALGNIGAVTGAVAFDAAKVLGGTAGTTLTLASPAANSYTATSDASGHYSTQSGYDLSAGSRSIATAGSALGDIALTNPITWTSGTLAVNTSGTITQSAAVSGTGTAIFNLQAGTWRQVNASLPAFAAQDFRISGGSFVRALSGDGTVGTPYRLADIYGMQGMGSSGMLLNKNYQLANDVDASGTANWNSGSGFAPVGTLAANFIGIFDGRSHTITGLTINRPASDYIGLFGYFFGTVRDVGLSGGSISGRDGVGALVGLGSNSHISGSYADVTISGRDWVGGLAGFYDNGSSIADSYASGAVTGGGFVGGLVGSNTTTSTIARSYATGAVSGSSSVGGLVGVMNGGSTATNSYWNKQTSGQATSAGGTGVNTTTLMQTQSTFVGFDFTNTWRIYEGHTAPLLKSFLTPLTVTASNAAKTYDGLAYSGGNGVSYSTPPNANLLGTASYGGTSQGAVNVGSYTITPGGLYSNQRGYDITFADGVLTVASVPTYAITVSAGTGGTASCAPNPVSHGGGSTCTATPGGGYSFTGWSGDCTGATCILSNVTSAKSVTASFLADGAKTYTAASATGTGNITASFTGGGAGCTYTVSQFIPLSGHAASPPAGSAPAGVSFPQGLFDFTTGGCTAGSTITLTITYPQALPAGTQYWKYGPTPGNAVAHWYILPATIVGATATFSIADGGLGDDDFAANGTIVDQGGPGVPGGGATGIPTLSEWAMLALAGLVGLSGLAGLRRQAKS